MLQQRLTTTMVAIIALAALRTASTAAAQGQPAEQTATATPAAAGRAIDEVTRASQVAAPLVPPPPTEQPPASDTAPTLAPNAVESQLAEGFAALREKRFADGVRIYADLVTAHPDDARFHYLLGKALVLAGDPRHAIPELREATQLSPSNADYHAELGNAHYSIGAHREAARAYRTALNLQATHFSATAPLWISRARLAEHERFVVPDPQPSGSAEPTEIWYGWQTLIADAGSIAWMAWTIAESGRSADHTRVGLFLSLGAYFLVSPMIHAAHGNTSAMGRSLIFRGSAILLALAGGAVAGVGSGCGGLFGCGLPIAAFVAVVGAVIAVSDAASAFREAPQRSRWVSVTPWFAARPGAGGLALHGRL